MDAEMREGVNLMKEDLINHPKHYADSCSLECIEAMEITFGINAVIQYCKIAAFKYIWRYKAKNGKEDLEKAKWYLEYIDNRIDSIESYGGVNKLLTQADKDQIIAMKRYYYKVIGGID